MSPRALVIPSVVVLALLATADAVPADRLSAEARIAVERFGVFGMSGRCVRRVVRGIVLRLLPVELAQRAERRMWRAWTAGIAESTS